jgi:hypothetical protein
MTAKLKVRDNNERLLREVGEDNKKISIEEDEEEIKGFLFGVLKKRKPHLAVDLSNFKSFLLSRNEQFENLKVWDMKGMLLLYLLTGEIWDIKLLKELDLLQIHFD